MVEQNARRALKLANRAYLLSLGGIVGEGAAHALGQDRAVAESYLGLWSPIKAGPLWRGAHTGLV